jgi:hypothetical protein
MRCSWNPADGPEPEEAAPDLHPASGSRPKMWRHYLPIEQKRCSGFLLGVHCPQRQLEAVEPVQVSVAGLLDLGSGYQSQFVGQLNLSFESRLISQRTHAESDRASGGLPDESPIQ